MNKKSKEKITESMVVTGIGLAAFYWICESFMYFFLEPEANIFQIILGPDLFQVRVQQFGHDAFLGFQQFIEISDSREAMDAIHREQPDLVVLSPGPGRPADFRLHHSLEVCLERGIPVFGVCLGLQGIVEFSRSNSPSCASWSKPIRPTALSMRKSSPRSSAR